MAMTRWNDPFRELASLQDRMNRIFEDTLSRSLSRREDEVAFGAWAPPVDIFETADRLVLRAELPGFTEEQVSLRIENGILSIEGERKFEEKSGSENYHRIERSYGRFVRSFSLPSAQFDAERISASMSNGILTVELPRREDTKPKRIKIHAHAGGGDVEGKG